jgi:molybdate transport system substrate-binding protein
MISIIFNYSRYVLLLCFFLTTFFYTNIQIYAGDLTVAVANSACNTIKKVGEIYSKNHGHKITYICKSSGRLAKGLRGEAISADIYISANRLWIDYMLKQDLVLKQDIISPWGNKLVVAVNKLSNLDINDLSELATDNVKTILIGDPGTAPFGRYAKETLKKTKLWEKVKHKIVTKKHITLLADALAIADASTVGILFFSNTTIQHRVGYSIDKSWHSAIRYYLAPLKNTSNLKHVSDYISFLQSPLSQEIFSDAGFDVKTD